MVRILRAPRLTVVSLSKQAGVRGFQDPDAYETRVCFSGFELVSLDHQETSDSQSASRDRARELTRGRTSYWRGGRSGSSSGLRRLSGRSRLSGHGGDHNHDRSGSRLEQRSGAGLAGEAGARGVGSARANGSRGRRRSRRRGGSRASGGIARWHQSQSRSDSARRGDGLGSQCDGCKQENESLGEIHLVVDRCLFLECLCSGSVVVFR